MPSPQNPVVRVTVDKDVYEIDFSDLTAIDSKDFRQAVGLPLMSVLTNPADADLDVFAGLVWLARRKTEPGLTYETVARAISWTSDLDIDQDVAASEDEHPEA